MKASSACLQCVKSHEGCELAAYPDPGSGGDPWTIGYGHTADVHKGQCITQEQADRFLSGDIAKFEEGVTALLGDAPTTQGQFDALVSFAFNLGLGALRGSTLLKKHKAGDYTGASMEFGKWIKASGKVLMGLIHRRADEAALYRGT